MVEPWSLEDIETGLAAPMIIDDSSGQSLPPALNIWLDGRLLAVLASSPRFSPPETEGYSYRSLEEDGSEWRVLSRFDESTGLWMLVGIELDVARWDILAMYATAMFPLLVILPLTVLILYLGVSRGLSPLKALANQISRRNPRVLDPVAPTDVPEEILPVVDSLNALLGRLALALESEQRFTANAAHELMTPLAAIKAEVQLCQRQLADPEGAAMLERIVLRVDRATHTVEQLLTLARLDPESPLPETSIDLRSLLGEILAELGHLAIERGLEIDLAEGGEVSVVGTQEALAILLRNLLTNAFRYADVGSVVRIDLPQTEKGKLLEICNACGPLSAEEYDKIGERFYRVPGSAGLGSGLGLSIVDRIARQHGARFSAGPREDGVGFCARIEFPAV